MEEERKGKKKIGSNYGILVILLFAIVAFLTDYIIIERKIRVCECPECETTSNEVISGNTDNTQVTEEKEDINNVDISSLEYIKTTELNIGCSNEINVKIEDGDIVISNGEKTIRYNGVDAKYIHWNAFLDCGHAILFYLTSDNNLFEINGLYDLFGDDHSKYIEPIKKADNVIEMIGNITSQDTYGDTVISSKGIKVLTVNNDVMTVYWHSFLPPTGKDIILFSEY